MDILLAETIIENPRTAIEREKVRKKTRNPLSFLVKWMLSKTTIYPPEG